MNKILRKMMGMALALVLVVALAGPASALKTAGPQFLVDGQFLAANNAASEAWAAKNLLIYMNAAYVAATKVLGFQLNGISDPDLDGWGKLTSRKIVIDLRDAVTNGNTGSYLAALPGTTAWFVAGGNGGQAGNVDGVHIDLYLGRGLSTSTANLKAYGAALANTVTQALFFNTRFQRSDTKQWAWRWQSGEVDTILGDPIAPNPAINADSGAYRLALAVNALGQYVKTCLYAQGGNFYGQTVSRQKSLILKALGGTVTGYTNENTDSTNTHRGWMGAIDDYLTSAVAGAEGIQDATVYGPTVWFGDVNTAQAVGTLNCVWRLAAIGFWVGASAQVGTLPNSANNNSAAATYAALAGTLHFSLVHPDGDPVGAATLFDQHSLATYAAFGSGASPNGTAANAGWSWDDGVNYTAGRLNTNPMVTYFNFWYNRPYIHE